MEHIAPEYGPSRLVQSAWVLGESRRPLTDVIGREHETIIAMALPGVRPQDVRVHVSPEGIEVWARHEEGIGFYRFIPAQYARVHATMERGILELRIPLEVSHATAQHAARH